MRLLISVVDTVPGNATHALRGHVIAVRRNDQDWGLQELLHPNWRIVEVPDLTDQEVQHLLEPAIAPHPVTRVPTIMGLRQRALDLSKIAGIDRPRTATLDRDMAPVPDLVLAHKPVVR